MSSRSFAGTFDAYREHIVFSVYAIGLGASTLLLVGMFAEAFVGRSPLKFSVMRVLEVVPIFSITNVLAFLLGGYFGILALLFLDAKKRAQSLLFFSVSVLALAGFVRTGVFFQYAGPLEVPAFVLGFVAVFYLIGGRKVRDIEIDLGRNEGRLLDIPRSEPLEFPLAERAMVVLLGGFVLISLFEAHTRRQALVVLRDGLPYVIPDAVFTIRFEFAEPVAWLGYASPEMTTSLYLLGTIGFLGFTRLFVGYEAEKRVVFIGPERSGKTHCILGCFLEAQNNNRARNPEGSILGFRQRFVTTESWLPPTEAETHKLKFEYTVGTLFKRNVIIDGLDYPGEFSRYIADGLEFARGRTGMYVPDDPDESPPDGYDTHPEAAAHRTTEEAQAYLRVVAEQMDYDSQQVELVPDTDEGYEIEGLGPGARAELYDTFELMIGEVIPRVRKADVLVYMFDGDVHESIAHGNGDLAEPIRKDVGYYQRITSMQTKHRRTAGVVTKADKLQEEFTDDNPGKRINSHFDSHFRPWVTTDLQIGPFADVLEAEGVDPMPVFFLEDRSSGEPLFQGGQPQYKGFQQLLEELG